MCPADMMCASLMMCAAAHEEQTSHHCEQSEQHHHTARYHITCADGASFVFMIPFECRNRSGPRPCRWFLCARTVFRAGCRRSVRHFRRRFASAPGSQALSDSGNRGRRSRPCGILPSVWGRRCFENRFWHRTPLSDRITCFTLRKQSNKALRSKLSIPLSKFSLFFCKKTLTNSLYCVHYN